MVCMNRIAQFELDGQIYAKLEDLFVPPWIKQISDN